MQNVQQCSKSPGKTLSQGDEFRDTRAELIAHVRTWLGTPFRHQGRLRKVVSPEGKVICPGGCDCAGLIIGGAREFGYDINVGFTDFTGYARMPDSDEMSNALNTFMTPVPISEIQPADVLHMRFLKHPQHLAILLDNNEIIHAVSDDILSDGGQVVIHRLSDVWLRRVVSAYKYKGID